MWGGRGRAGKAGIPDALHGELGAWFLLQAFFFLKALHRYVCVYTFVFCLFVFGFWNIIIIIA